MEVGFIRKYYTSVQIGKEYFFECRECATIVTIDSMVRHYQWHERSLGDGR